MGKTAISKAKNYLSVYEKFNLVRENSIFGHCIHLSEKELEILEEKLSVAHCPTSNLLLDQVFLILEVSMKILKLD